MRENVQITTQREAETIGFAQGVADSLCAGDVVLLRGDLGMGKSVFSRAVIRSLCEDDALEVPSPTFTLVQQYDALLADIWHFDLYRLSDQSEIYEIGWEEAMDGGISLIEWPERLGGLTPARCIEVSISPVSGAPDARKIEVIYHE
ncbi:MAG: tRNA (adenosine(37)-N6)-threonylcarbamoyltransferase complex ATPase subunit type 1 TsaE [Alphaproteobacteria bacterium]